ncbi:MAG: amidoligase family protein [Clostridia bacterium]|nr:amidoligase family protein [Clostridia bacterium]
MDLREQRFGIEIEMTGITRNRAAQVMSEFFGNPLHDEGGSYGTFSVRDEQGRLWKVVRDGSITCQRKLNGRTVATNNQYSVELVSPICRYEDIENLQELVRHLRQSGAFVNSSCGIHIHIDAAPFTAPQLRNLVNIMAAKEDMIYRALQVHRDREVTYCKKIDPDFLRELNRHKPTTLESLKQLWYRGDDGSAMHYHSSRYRCLNLHSVFQKGTIEFRAFNATLHAGVIKAYLQFCLAITAQAHNQRSASFKKTVSDNEKYTFRVWLLRLGMIGDEFKTARHHLLNHLEGNIAWKDPAQAERQKERRAALREQKEREAAEQHLQSTEQLAQPEHEESPNRPETQQRPSGLSMSMTM